MVIIVTGAIGIGKTTVCQKLIETVRNQGHICGGVLTHKAPDRSLTILDIQTGKTQTLASIDNIYNGPRTAKYSFNPEGIDFGTRAIEGGITSDILFVDELGHLELGGEGFVKSLELIKEDKVKNAVLVIRKQLLPAFLARLDVVKPLVLETTVTNRNQLPVEIGAILTEKLR
ncbi:nucleoside-triphosphatase [Chloroflexota bacterium]